MTLALFVVGLLASLIGASLGVHVANIQHRRIVERERLEDEQP